MKKHSKALYVFSQDLRVEDNPLLNLACQNSQQMMCLYCMEPWQFKPTFCANEGMGSLRFQFLSESLLDLQSLLEQQGMNLDVRMGHRSQIISELIKQHAIDAVYQANSAGVFENKQWQWLQRQHPAVSFHAAHNQALFDEKDLPFVLVDLPESFTPFRKRVEELPINELSVMPARWPDVLTEAQASIKTWPRFDKTNIFQGGQTAAQEHLETYFLGQAPAVYKQVRNELDGWENSTKFSPWLALGCVSPRQIHQRLRQYESEQGANQSTYWIFFELLWREYFYWYGLKHGRQLFLATGIKNMPDISGHRVDRHQVENYLKWCSGCTGAGLVDACMNQLNSTGYMSNRGRQIVASFLLHELQVDWRWGAQYFEQMLLDYDVTSNWGNWQYIAGVGADPRGGRYFNLQNQQKVHDPQGLFIARWASQQVVAERVSWQQVSSY